jgi:trk system potassium uptake protein TrkH
VFYAKEGFVTVALSWIILSVMGALPFVINEEIPNFTDALFEIISGFTTTGASILSDVEALSHCSLIWRSFSHWIGGMGVLVFILAILPLAGGGHSMHLLRAESPGPSVGKLVPRLRSTAMILYGIYFFMTVIELIILLIAKMPLFDAICTAFGTAGTGGFGIKNDSMTSYSTLIQGIVTVFMILFGVNFNVYYLFLIKKPKEALKCEELRYYLGIIGFAILFITINIRGLFPSIFKAFHHAAFQVGSIITTTGFATEDFNIWPQASKTLLVIIMFIGACAGSTGGGIKVSRFALLLKTVGKELSHLIHPRSIKIIKFEGKKVEHDVIRSVNVFLITYVLIFAFSVLAICIDGLDLTTNFTAVAATLNNIGPGLELVGPTQNFSVFSSFSKYILMFDMLAGRLELFPMLILFTPATWKK